MQHTWIITKSQPHADSVVIQLRRQGFQALAVCCIEHQWRDWPELRQMGARSPALLFVTSRAAAARVEVPPGTRVAAQRREKPLARMHVNRNSHGIK